MNEKARGIVMDFEIMNAIYRMKQKRNYIVLETKGDKDFIVERKCFELVLVSGNPATFVEGYALTKGSMEGITRKDVCGLRNGKTCEKFELNELGKRYYELMEIEQRIPSFYKALKEMRKMEKPRHLTAEKTRIRQVLKENKITSLQKYNPKDFVEESTMKM